MDTAEARARPSLPVLIAGGGPTGLTLAMGLAVRGVRSVILEPRETDPPNPRCNTTNSRSMEIFRQLGCADAVRAAGLPLDHSTDVVYMTSLAGAEITRFVRPTAAAVIERKAEGIGADWPTPEPQHFISQLFLEPVLRRRAVELGVEIRTGWSFVDFIEEHDRVVSTTNGPDGEVATIDSEFLVGADGATSAVRRAVGATLEGIPAIENTVSLFFRSRQVTELSQRAPGWMYRFPRGTMLVAIAGDDRWLIHTQVPVGEDPETFDPEPVLFAALGQPVEYEVISISRWTARAMVANKLRHGRVALIGDAAHIWIPMGGFGMNAGVGDADALAWRLAGLLDGWLDYKVLYSYDIERRSLGERVAAQAPQWRARLQPLMQLDPQTWADLAEPANGAARADLGARIQEANRSEWESAGLQLGFSYESSAIVAYDDEPAPAFSIESYVESSSPGARAPHFWRDGVHSRSIYDDLGTGFALMRFGVGTGWGARLIRSAEARGIPLRVVDVVEPEAFESYGDYSLVLVRPDHYIAWRSRGEAADPEWVWDVVTGLATAEPPIHALPLQEARDVAPSELTMLETDVVCVEVIGSRIALRFEGEGLVEPTYDERIVASDGSRVFALDHEANRLVHGRIRGDAGSPTLAPFVALSRIENGTRAEGLALDRGDGVWVCLPESELAVRFDRAGRQTHRVTTPAQPRACRVTPDHSTLIVAGGSTPESIWVGRVDITPLTTE